MTEIQEIEFELLKDFVKVCETLDLTYYLVCGSALGAVKYRGFIPWDDDIDVALPRRDYEIFCKNAQGMLPDNVFLQNYKTDKNYPRIYSKLRNTKTTYVEKPTRSLDMNHGVFIDVFPLDGYPEDSKVCKIFELKKKILKLKIECVFDVNYGFLRNTFFFIERVLRYHKRTGMYIQKLEKLISKYNTGTSPIWCNHGNWQGKLEYAPREQYGNGAWAVFEGLKVRVPEMYDEYLTQKYGDWRADIPKEQQVGHHYYEICDLNRPYTDYIKFDESKKYDN